MQNCEPAVSSALYFIGDRHISANRADQYRSIVVRDRAGCWPSGIVQKETFVDRRVDGSDCAERHLKVFGRFEPGVRVDRDGDKLPLQRRTSKRQGSGLTGNVLKRASQRCRSAVGGRKRNCQTILNSGRQFDLKDKVGGDTITFVESDVSY